MIGKLAPYVVVGLIQTTLILVMGTELFDVPINGHVWQLYVGASLFIGATLALGLAISTFAQTQFQAMQLGFFTMLPSILLSGFLFPFDGMPEPAQWIAQVLPLTHFNTVVRGVVLRGRRAGGPGPAAAEADASSWWRPSQSRHRGSGSAWAEVAGAGGHL